MAYLLNRNETSTARVFLKCCSGFNLTVDTEISCSNFVSLHCIHRRQGDEEFAFFKHRLCSYLLSSEGETTRFATYQPTFLWDIFCPLLTTVIRVILRRLLSLNNFSYSSVTLIFIGM